MFIPLQLNTPVLIGGIISWFVSSRSKNAEVNKARQEHGTLIASGFIAGGALLGVVGMIIALPLTTLLVSYYKRFVLHLPEEQVQTTRAPSPISKAMSSWRNRKKTK